MENPAEKESFLSNRDQAVILEEYNPNFFKSDWHFKSDLHEEDNNMMAEIYGSGCYKIWMKTHKKWWI